MGPPKRQRLTSRFVPQISQMYACSVAAPQGICVRAMSGAAARNRVVRNLSRLNDLRSEVRKMREAFYPFSAGDVFLTIVIMSVTDLKESRALGSAQPMRSLVLPELYR